MIDVVGGLEFVRRATGSHGQVSRRGGTGSEWGMDPSSEAGGREASAEARRETMEAQTKADAWGGRGREGGWRWEVTPSHRTIESPRKSSWQTAFRVQSTSQWFSLRAAPWKLLGSFDTMPVPRAHPHSIRFNQALGLNWAPG